MQYPLDIKLQYCYRNSMGEVLRGDPRGFISRVETAREDAGLGVYEFSDVIGQAPSYWSSWMSRHRARGGFPKGDIMAVMADKLHVSMDYLLGKDVPDSPPAIQTAPLADLLKRIRAVPNLRLTEDRPLAHAGRDGAPLLQGFDESRPRRPAPKGKSKKDKDVERFQDVEVIGHCMETVLYPGDVVTVDTRVLPNFGDVVVGMRFHDEMLIKFLRTKDEHQYLESKDGQVIPLDQYIRILGPVVFVQVSIRRLL